MSRIDFCYKYSCNIDGFDWMEKKRSDHSDHFALDRSMAFKGSSLPDFVASLDYFVPAI